MIWLRQKGNQEDVKQRGSLTAHVLSQLLPDGRPIIETK